MARCLIIGCGCRGQMLARALVERGHAVRGTTRQPERVRDIEAAGAEPAVAGSVTDRPGKYVTIPAVGLVGRGDAFEAVHDNV